jgi:hypothetical protein
MSSSSESKYEVRLKDGTKIGDYYVGTPGAAATQAFGIYRREHTALLVKNSTSSEFKEQSSQQNISFSEVRTSTTEEYITLYVKEIKTNKITGYVARLKFYVDENKPVDRKINLYAKL